MKEKIESIRHKEKRAHIPSKEEAGYENANEKVTKGKTVAEYPKNPVVHRGMDPELFWMNKYGEGDNDDILKIDIRSLYRHEHIAPEKLIEGLYKIVEEKKHPEQDELFSINELFGNALEKDELEKVSEYYKHNDGWSNRIIQGDSLLVMNSLLEREGMAGQVQCIYIDPPYGIKYGSNWQMKLNKRDVKDGSDEELSGEPEQIKAYRDTWELGIHSYLTYLRDRLITARELLTESGSCFVQISDENVHLVRCLMDEVFGSENFVSEIIFRKKGMTLGSQTIETMNDYILFYAKNFTEVKYRKLFDMYDVQGASRWTMVEEANGTRRKLTQEEYINHKELRKGDRVFRLVSQRAPSFSPKNVFDFEYKGSVFKAPGCWVTNLNGMEKLGTQNRFYPEGKNLSYIQYHDDFPMKKITNLWLDTTGANDKRYVVQTSEKVIMRCILMSTDPGDLVLDPTCGSGTTAFVAEQWGRRWITIDTSRIAMNIAKTRLMTATFPYYYLYSDVNVTTEGKDGKLKKTIVEKKSSDKTHEIRQGFVYEEVPHITLKSLANDEPPATETLYDKPSEDKKRIRVSGPFTVETLQNYEPISPDAMDDHKEDDTGNFEENIFAHLKTAGVKNGIKNEMAVFVRIEKLADSYLHAEGFYNTSKGEKKAYFHIGPKFGTVSKLQVNQAVKTCRTKGDADWLVVLGFSFESDISNENVTTSMGSFEVTKVRMHDDLMQDGLLKKDKKAGSFITIGEPDIKLIKKGSTAQVEVCGLDIYDPIKDIVKARNIEDIAYWMVDSNYDGSNFVAKQVFFCGGDKDEFDKWKKGLESLSVQKSKISLEKTLKIEIDDEAFERLYGFKSHPFEYKAGQKIAVRVISQFGEESTKVM